MTSFASEASYPFHWADIARAVWAKYPNPLAEHVRSVDTISRTIDDRGVIRTERIIGVEQGAPRWVMKVPSFLSTPEVRNVNGANVQLVGGGKETYVREITFIVPHLGEDGAGAHQPPAVLQASINLSMGKILTCHERISYIPLSPSSTMFSQLATFTARGTIARGQTWESVGKRVERVSVDRYALPYRPHSGMMLKDWQ